MIVRYRNDFAFLKRYNIEKMAVRQVQNTFESIKVTRLIFCQAKAIYDFDAEPGTGEISIQTGEVLTVTRTDVGEGWWEGELTRILNTFL